MLPSFVGIGNGPTPSHPSPTSPTFSPNSPPLTIALVPHEQQELRQQPPPQRSPGQSSYLSTAPLFALPLLLSGVCRKVHAVLTGRRAQARARANGAVDIMADGLRDIWDRLDRCWEGFDALRRNGGICRAEDETEKYIGGWQVCCADIIPRIMTMTMTIALL
jgi:hypothetical protein